MATAFKSPSPALVQRGITVPAEPSQMQPFGEDEIGPNFENLEKLKPELVATLRDLTFRVRMEGIVARRHEIRKARLARLYWQGLQYAWFNPQDLNWHLPFESRLGDDSNLEEMPRYQFVTNYYQGYGLTFISLMSQDTPTVRFYPQSAQNVQDIYAAKAASEVAKLVEQNNRVQNMLTGIAYYLWTDGKIGAYVRYVADGQRFGFKQQPEMEEGLGQIGQDQFQCPQCGAPSGAAALLGGTICPECGTELGEDNFKPADLAAVPNVTGTRKLPNGQEVITIVGGLELNTPVWAYEQYEFPYLQWQTEVHRSKLRAVYPHVADKIEAGTPYDAEDVYARASRLSVAQGLPQIHPTDALANVITFSRTWLRPWAFMDLDNKEIRDELMQMFPDGCYVAFAGYTYCESRNENLDDYWKVMNALPGDGTARPGVGDSMVQVQERYNTLSNIQAETYEFGIPPIYVDPDTLDVDSLTSQVAEPGAHYPARPRAGMPLAASFFQPPAGTVSPDFIKHQQDLVGPVSQFLTGLFPAIFGGEMQDVKTATGYAIARDQALGRLGLIWRRLKQFYADTMLLAVDCFRQNRADDVEIPILGDDGEFDSEWIRIADLKGNIQAYPEADETFPRLKSQQRNVLQQLMANPDPIIAKIMSEPANLGTIKTIFGLTEIIVPGEDSRNKQLREIDQLLQAQPMMEMAADPMTGAAMPRESPTVPVDDLLDDHASEFEECKRWANSEAGQKAHTENAAGFANVHAHAQAHFVALQQQMIRETQIQGAKAIGG